jgi:hypothetical protein
MSQDTFNKFYSVSLLIIAIIFSFLIYTSHQQLDWTSLYAFIPALVAHAAHLTYDVAICKKEEKVK